MTPATGNPRKFHKGPPPFPGWWWTDTRGFFCDWRWWDGKQWGIGCCENEGPTTLLRAALNRTCTPSHAIQWSDYWPANARVPRINPNKEAA